MAYTDPNRRCDMRWKDRDSWLHLEFMVGLVAVVILLVANFVWRFMK